MSIYPLKMLICLMILLVPTLASANEPLIFYVSPDAASGGDGTQEKPFGSLEAARDAARADTDRGVAEIILLAGRYFRDQTFQLSAQDSHTTYRAAEGAKVLIDGGRTIPVSSCVKVTDNAILTRLIEPNVANKLYSIDLTALGIADFGEFGPRGFQRPVIPAPVEVFIDGSPLLIARWPNEGEKDLPLGEVVDSGSVRRYNKQEPPRPGSFKYETPRAARWTQATDIFLRGFFSNGFADDSIPVEKIDTETGVVHLGESHLYGIGAGKPPSVWCWHAENLLEEIDQPREYYLDRKSGALYFYPPSDFQPDSEGHVLQVSQLTDPMVIANNVTSLIWDGVTFENSRGEGGRFQGEMIRLSDCTFRNLGGRGLSIEGRGNLVQGCELVHLGSGGVSLSGGNRRTLEPGNNVVRHCDISRVNRWHRVYRPAISLSGAGNFIQHNHLHDCPGQGIVMSGNDHVIEYNEFGHLIESMSDQGAIYMGRNPSCAGNIFRYNYIHDTVSSHTGYGNSGIFFDDGASGQFVQGNVFFNTGKNGAIKYHGGQFNTFINNVVVDCTMPVKYQLWDQRRWEIFLAGKQQVDNLLRHVNVIGPPYSTRYPQLAAIFQTPYSRDPVGESSNWITTAADPLFKNGAAGNFQIRDYDELRKEVPGFAKIAWEKIGPQPRNRRAQCDPETGAVELANRLKEQREVLTKQDR